MATNPSNSFNLTGRLTKDPVIFENPDGSKKVVVSIACRDNFASRDGEYHSQFIDVQDFVRAGADGLGVYGMIGKGDLIEVVGSIRNNNWTGKDGVAHYDIVMRVDAVTMLESKATTQARRAAAAVEAAEGKPEAALPEEPEVIDESADLADIL